MKQDPLESMLKSASGLEPPSPQPAPDLAEQVLQTVAQRETHRRRRIVATGLVGCYLAGVLTSWLCLSSGLRETNAPTHVVQQQMKSSAKTQTEQTIVHQTPSNQVPPIKSVDTNPSLQQASKPPKTLYKLLRDIGNASCAREDFASAIRYYELALNSASESEFHSTADQDNFLLLSLKEDRTESSIP